MLQAPRFPGFDECPIGGSSFPQTLRRVACSYHLPPKGTRLGILSPLKVNSLDRRALRRAKKSDMAHELIDTGTDKRYVRRDEDGQFKESDDVGRSLSQNQKRDAKTKTKSGEGDKGDR